MYVRMYFLAFGDTSVHAWCAIPCCCTMQPWLKTAFSSMSPKSVNGGQQGALQAYLYWKDYMQCNTSATPLRNSETYQEAMNKLTFRERVRFEIARSTHRDVPFMVNSAIECKAADDRTDPNKKKRLGAGCTSATLDDVMADYQHAFRHIIGPTLLENINVGGALDVHGTVGSRQHRSRRDADARRSERTEGNDDDADNGNGVASNDGAFDEDDEYCEGNDCIYMLVPPKSTKIQGPRRFFGAVGTLVVVGNEYGQTPKGAKLKLSHVFQEKCINAKKDLDVVPTIHAKDALVPNEKYRFFHLDAFKRISIENAAKFVKALKVSDASCGVQSVQSVPGDDDDDTKDHDRNVDNSENDDEEAGFTEVMAQRKKAAGNSQPTAKSLKKDAIPWGAPSFKQKIEAFEAKCGTPEHSTHATANKDQREERIQIIKAIDQMYFGGQLAKDSKLMMDGGLVTHFPQRN